MRSLKIVSAAVVAALALPAVASASDGGVAVGKFNRNLQGVSVFTQQGASVTLYGAYRGLRGNRSYFSVLYGNGNCDPAQAFPVGPFTTNGWGQAVANVQATMPAPAGLIGGTRSISVRRGDNDQDLDGDGITGPGDVVAVPGKPGIGLIECDGRPFVFAR